jgi:hypothetical protein
VGGLAASSPAVLGDRRCWFSGEEICSADGLVSKRCARASRQQNRARNTANSSRNARGERGFAVGEAQISANFKHFCNVEFASGNCPHLAIRDSEVSARNGGATLLLHSRDLVTLQKRPPKKGKGWCPEHARRKVRSPSTASRLAALRVCGHAHTFGGSLNRDD